MRLYTNDWKIYYDPPPIPVRDCDYHFVHREYDGAPDAHDHRYGHAASYDDAVMQIIGIIATEEDELI